MGGGQQIGLNGEIVGEEIDGKIVVGLDAADASRRYADDIWTKPIEQALGFLLSPQVATSRAAVRTSHPSRASRRTIAAPAIPPWSKRSSILRSKPPSISSVPISRKRPSRAYLTTRAKRNGERSTFEIPARYER